MHKVVPKPGNTNSWKEDIKRVAVNEAVDIHNPPKAVLKSVPEFADTLYYGYVLKDPCLWRHSS